MDRINVLVSGPISRASSSVADALHFQTELPIRIIGLNYEVEDLDKFEGFFKTDTFDTHHNIKDYPDDENLDQVLALLERESL